METKKELEKKANKLWSQIVLKHGNAPCFINSNHGRAKHPHHFVFRSRSLALKFDTRNGIPLCVKCHFAIHRRQDAVIQGVIALKKGQKWLDYIQEKKKIKVTKSKRWLQEQIEILEKEESL